MSCKFSFTDPQFLVAEEDVVEVTSDELSGATRLFQQTLPALQPHPSISQPKGVIFIERTGIILA